MRVTLSQGQMQLDVPENTPGLKDRSFSSTELARSSNLETDKIRHGMINMRCDGEKIIIAQMKEVVSEGKVWDLYDDAELYP